MITTNLSWRVLLTLMLCSHGYGSDMESEGCQDLYELCRSATYFECAGSSLFHFCCEHRDFLYRISKLYDVEDAIPPIKTANQWPYLLIHASGPYKKHKIKPVKEDEKPRRGSRYYDVAMDTDPEYLVSRVIEKTVSDNDYDNHRRRKKIQRRSSYDSIHDEVDQRLYEETMKLKRDIERQEQAKRDILRIKYPYYQDEQSDGEAGGQQNGVENENGGQGRTLNAEDGDFYASYDQASEADSAQEAHRDQAETASYANGFKIQADGRSSLFKDDLSTIRKSANTENDISNPQESLRENKGATNDYESSRQYQEENTKDEGVQEYENRQQDGLQSEQDVKFSSEDRQNVEALKHSSEEVASKHMKQAMKEHKKKDLIFVEVEGNDDIHIIAKSEDQGDADQDQGHLILHVKEKVNNTAARTFANRLQNVLWGLKASTHSIFPQLSAKNTIITLHMVTNPKWFKQNENARDVANQLNKDKALRDKIAKETGVTIISADSRGAAVYHHPVEANIADWDQFALVTAIVGGCTLGIIVAAVVVCCIKRSRNKGSLVDVKKQEAILDYQELVRAQMSTQAPDSSRHAKATYDQQRHGLVNGQGKVIRRTWGEEPQMYNMDISTGHVVLAYMEDHLKNENRLNKEWEFLCSYKAEPGDTSVGKEAKNSNKNRYVDVLPFDHSRVKLKETTNVLQSDYINANFVTDVDPRNPTYIATQGPLENTIADFWQMVWEQGVVVIVNLTRLSDMGMAQCNRYWPEDGSEVHHIYEIHLISEHIWCDDYLVRSFYLKNIQTSETRTVTQFHFLTWPDLSVPDSPKALLEFRRKVNKCYRGQACPIIVHCNNGVGRTGTYILVDLVLSRMIKGAKEIDIAATLEHLRDQRPDMVKTKAQFEFALAAVAEEVTAILTSLPS